MMLSAIGLAVAGCGGRNWPTVRGIASPTMVSTTAAVTTVDLLPVDLAVSARPGYPTAPEVLDGQVLAAVQKEVAQALVAHGYSVAPISWTGSYIGADGHPHEAMAGRDLAATVASLSSYGAAEAKPGSEGRLLVPFLPARLGQKTGSDATLYVGGRAYVGIGDAPESGAHKVAKGILIGLAVVVVAAAVIFGLEHSGSDEAEAVGHAAAGAARAAGHAVAAVGHAALTGVRVLAHTGFRTTAAVVTHTDNIYIGIDAFGHSHTHMAMSAPPPAPVRPPAADAPSSVIIEMTLIDNRTGLTLWHARHRFWANMARDDHRRQVVARMLASLPAAHR